MQVRVHREPLDLDGYYVLKVYDRRVMEEPRHPKGSSPWSPTLEKNYRCANIQRQYWESFSDSDSSGENSPTSSVSSSMSLEQVRVAETEDEIQKNCFEDYKIEAKVYHRLHDLQGKHIPRLLAHVEVPDYYVFQHGFPTLLDAGYSDQLSTPGLLLQLIPNAISLTDLYAMPTPPVPREA
jgi:hypothetical protein